MSEAVEQVTEETFPSDAVEADTESGEKRRGWVGFLQILAIAACLVLAFAFSREDTAAPPPQAVVPAAAAAPAVADLLTVRIVQPETAPAQIAVAGTGSVGIRSRVELMMEATGRVVEVSDQLRAGGRFAAGDVLVRIDDRELALAVQQARADLRVAESALALSEAESAAARSNYALIHPNKPAPPLVAKLPQIEQARAQVDAARARLATAQLQLSRAVLTLPFAGTVIASDAEPGQVLRSQMAFGSVFANDAVEVTVPISEQDLMKLQPAEGRAAIISTPSGELNAVVARVAPELDERTRLAKLFLTLPDSQTLPPGAFVDVTIQGGTAEKAVVLPSQAQQGGGLVWVVRDGVLEPHEPRVLSVRDGELVVAEFDVASGVVVSPLTEPQAGVSVAVAGGA